MSDITAYADDNVHADDLVDDDDDDAGDQVVVHEHAEATLDRYRIQISR